MARRLFGTDGVRGIAGDDLTEELVARLGHAFATWNGGGSVLVARDTRASGPGLEAALCAGLTAGGADVRIGGVLPTPAVPLLADGAGGVVTASHNPPEWNGVKFFDADGRKLEEDAEEELERRLAAASGRQWPECPSPRPEEGLAARYLEVVTDRFGSRLDGLRVACDCANGAMSELAPAALERLGASVTAVGNEPDGTNINVGCGATDLSLLARVVSGQGFDLGVAFDGDGDRMLAVDGAGREVDGDEILAILALHLRVELVAVTTLTNLGFHRLMRERGIRVVTTDVGDRYVLEALRAEGGVLGGEQSGHVVYLEGQTTGDGLVAALLLARAVAESGKPLTELARVMPRFPQVKRNVPVRAKELTAAVRDEVARLNGKLGERGRVLVRPSGTEPVVRVLAEAESRAEAEDACAKLGRLVRQELG